MAIFCIKYVRTSYYEVECEADNENEADKKATDILLKNPSAYWVDDSDFDIESIENEDE